MGVIPRFRFIYAAKNPANYVFLGIHNSQKATMSTKAAQKSKRLQWFCKPFNAKNFKKSPVPKVPHDHHPCITPRHFTWRTKRKHPTENGELLIRKCL